MTGASARTGGCSPTHHSRKSTPARASVRPAPSQYGGRGCGWIGSMYAICTTGRSRCPAVRGPNCQTMRRLPAKFAWERPGRLGHDQADDVTGLEPKRLREREYDSEHPSRAAATWPQQVGEHSQVPRHRGGRQLENEGRLRVVLSHSPTAEFEPGRCAGGVATQADSAFTASVSA